MEEEAYIRVDGRAECPTCGCSYRSHPIEVKFTETFEEVPFRRACSGMLVKL